MLRERQRALAYEGDSVMEGRDIGAVVCPDADVKVFLTADEAERARRRTDDRPGLGADALATDLRLRDERDAAQMGAAPDATRDRHDRPRDRRGRRARSSGSSPRRPEA